MHDLRKNIIVLSQGEDNLLRKEKQHITINLVDTGKIHKNNKGLEYIVLGKTKNKTKSGNLMVLIRFRETGYEYEVDPAQIKRGTVKDRWHRNVLGVGYIGDVIVKGNERAYNIWHKMLGRCYSPKYANYGLYGGMGITVSDRWLCFENFLNDIPRIDGYDKEKFDVGSIQLDKDLKQLGKAKENMTYSIETCTFMSGYDNSMLVDNEFKKSVFIAISPEGVKHYPKGIKEFCRNNDLTYNLVRLVMNGKQKHHKGWVFHRINADNMEVLLNVIE